MTSEAEWRRIANEKALGRKGIRTGSLDNAIEVRKFEQEQRQKKIADDEFLNLHKSRVITPPDNRPISRRSPDNDFIDLGPVRPSTGAANPDSSALPLPVLIVGGAGLLMGMLAVLNFLLSLTAENWVVAGLYLAIITAVVSLPAALFMALRRSVKGRGGRFLITVVSVAVLGVVVFSLFCLLFC